MPKDFELQDAAVRQNYIDMWKKNMQTEDLAPHYKNIMGKTLDNMEYLHDIWLKHETKNIPLKD